MKKVFWKRYKIVNRTRFIVFLTICILLLSFAISSFINISRAINIKRETAKRGEDVCEESINKDATQEPASSRSDSLEEAQVKIENTRNEHENIAVVVSYGDTLWQLAKEYGNPNKDIREVIYDIRKLNNIDPESLRPGDVILIPKE